MEQEFEEYWKAHRKQLITHAPQRLADERAHSLGMNTLGDWLLWLVPIGVMVMLMDYRFVESKLVNFIILLAICVGLVAVCQMLKPYVTGKRDVADIDRDIHDYYYREYQRTGRLGF